MPRDGKLIWCDRCGIFLAPAGKKPRAGERAAGVLTDTVMLCDRHTPAPAEEMPEPAALIVETPAPEPAAEPTAPVVTGKERLAAAAEEAAGWSGRYGSIRGRLPATPPAPVAQDVKETRKEDRPVRRPAKPRREGTEHGKTAAREARLDELHRLLTEGTPREEAVAAAGYASLASARVAVANSGRDDLRLALRQRKPGPAAREQKAAPQVAERWPAEMPGAPKRDTARPQAPTLVPVPAGEVARRNREAAAAYAAKHGHRAPVTRRGIVSAAEILADVDRDRLDGSAEIAGQEAAAAYLGVSKGTLQRWMTYFDLPSEKRGSGPCGVVVYRAGDLAALAALAAQIENAGGARTAIKQARATA